MNICSGLDNINNFAEHKLVATKILIYNHRLLTGEQFSAILMCADFDTDCYFVS